MDLTDLSVGLGLDGTASNDLLLTRQIALERGSRAGPFRDLETRLQQAVKNSDQKAILELLQHSTSLLEQQDGKTHVCRILWKTIIDAPPELADLIMFCPAAPFDFQFVDDINSRTCLHEAAMSGQLRLVNLCLDKGVKIDKVDVYGMRTYHSSQ